MAFSAGRLVFSVHLSTLNKNNNKHCLSCIFWKQWVNINQKSLIHLKAYFNICRQSKNFTVTFIFITLCNDYSFSKYRTTHYSPFLSRYIPTFFFCWFSFSHLRIIYYQPNQNTHLAILYHYNTNTLTQIVDYMIKLMSRKKVVVQ